MDDVVEARAEPPSADIPWSPHNRPYDPALGLDAVVVPDVVVQQEPPA